MSTNRHLQRIKAVKEIFSQEFSTDQKFDSEITSKVISHLDQIDKLIVQAAPAWPIEKINKLDLAILRLAVFELLIEQNNPPKVVVNEAVEIAKEFGSDASPGFINGALGKLISDNNIKT